MLLHRAHGFDRQAQQGQGYIRAFIRSRYTRGGSAARRNGGGGLQERHAFYCQRLPLLQHKGIRQFCPQGKQQPRRSCGQRLALIHIPEPTRLGKIS